MKPADELRKWGAATAAAKARRDSIAALLDECERVLADIARGDLEVDEAMQAADTVLAKLRGQT